MAAEDRLLPEDVLREGESGEWFPASEMDNLFPRRAGHGRDDEDRDDQPRIWKRKRKGSNYYGLVWRNFQEGGQWISILLVTLGLQVLIPVIVGLIALAIMGFTRPGAGAGAAVGRILGAACGYGAFLALAFFLDVLVFGIPFSLLRVRLDSRRDNVLELFSYSYLVGLLPKLIIIFVALGSFRWEVVLALIYPFIHAGVLVYLMYTYWGLSGGKCWLLAGIRFFYQMVFLVAYVVIRLV
jgi:hypothetical protein